MLTGRRSAAIPVLTFAAEPHGAPPPVLCASATGDYAHRPVGGDPVLVLRKSADVVRSLVDGTHFAMAGVTGTGELHGSPLTGAEMQSPDGGLLNMNAPGLLTYRHRINHLFTRRAAETTRPAIHALAIQLAAGLAGRPTADALAGFAEPFTAAAVCSAMGVPASDWSQVLEFSRVAFAVVPGPAAVSDVAAAWAALYDYYGSLVAAKRARPDGTLTSRIVSALDGSTASQVTHVVGTVSNGFGAVLPVLAVALAEVAQRPQVIAACLRGERTWASVAEQLLRLRTIFPVALPRVVLADTQLGGRLVTRGTVVLPSLIAAAHDLSRPAPCNIAFGAGPHFCPGAALTRLWLACALAGFFGAFPRARLAGRLEWQPGTLSVPREIVLALR
jgi:cytochrome P450